MQSSWRWTSMSPSSRRSVPAPHPACQRAWRRAVADTGTHSPGPPTIQRACSGRGAIDGPWSLNCRDRVEVEWFEQVGPDRQPEENELSVSDAGLIAAARVTPRNPEDGEPFIAVFHVRALDPDGRRHEDSTQHHFRPVPH